MEVGLGTRFSKIPVPGFSLKTKKKTITVGPRHRRPFIWRSYFMSEVNLSSTFGVQNTDYASIAF